MFHQATARSSSLMNQPTDVLLYCNLRRRRLATPFEPPVGTAISGSSSERIVEEQLPSMSWWNLGMTHLLEAFWKCPTGGAMCNASQRGRRFQSRKAWDGQRNCFCELMNPSSIEPSYDLRDRGLGGQSKKCRWSNGALPDKCDAC